LGSNNGFVHWIIGRIAALDLLDTLLQGHGLASCRRPREAPRWRP
jgi:hypothetical protein